MSLRNRKKTSARKRVLTATEACAALDRIHAAAKASGASELRDEEIDALIAAARSKKVRSRARGAAITVVPVGKQLTTQQAADLLNVSRQYLVRLLDAGRIPSSKTGKHRRVRIEDVLAFAETRDEGRAAALTKLTRLSEELGGYPELG